jgi:tetratricopeptide (TPR) repeat protein
MGMPQFDCDPTGHSVIPLADQALVAGQWPIAAGYFRTVLDSNPKAPLIWVKYGQALREVGELAQAETAYRNALSIDWAAADSHLQLGHVLKMQGKEEDAEASYLRAFALDPSKPYPLQELSRLGWSEGELSELRTWVGFDHLRALHPGHPDAASEALHPEPVNGSSAVIHQGFDRVSVPVSETSELRSRIEASGLFNPEVYLSLHDDLRQDAVDPWEHFLNYGLNEGRHFTSCEVVARLLAQMDLDLKKEYFKFRAVAQGAFAGADRAEVAALFRRKGVRIGVFCSSVGNFFMREFADLFAWGLQAEGIEAVQRDETASQDEPFGLRVFVAPQEFFSLGEGRTWTALASAPNSVLYNIDQVQSTWFCHVFLLFLKAPLVLDVNFQSAAILRRAGCNAVHFMPGHLPAAPHAQPCLDLSGIELVTGYAFAHQPYNWLERNHLGDRPIDILFIGTSVPRRDKALARLQDLSDRYRFVFIYTRQEIPLTDRNYRSNSTTINCALAQRAKIVLNIHRDWLGYFEWSRMVLQGFWQGACVVSEPNLPNPMFEPGEHYLEESTRHVGELIRWLLSTSDGRQRLDTTRIRGYEQACGVGSMQVALAPVLDAFRQLLSL